MPGTVVGMVSMHPRDRISLILSCSLGRLMVGSVRTKRVEIVGLTASIQGLANNAVASAASSDPFGAGGAGTKPKLSPVNQLLQDALDAINNRAYFNVARLDQANLDRLKFRESNPARQGRVSLGDNFVLSSASDFDQQKYDTVADMSRTENGFYKSLSLYPKSRFPHLIPDRMSWMLKTKAFPASSEYARAVYCRTFMYNHCDKDNWDELFSTDSALLFAMTAQQFPGSSRGRDRDNDRSGKRRKISSVGGGSTGGGGGGGGSSGGGGGRKPKAICFSRMDAAKGECSYPRCRFSHKCPCCDKDHSAASCPQWDAVKAKKGAEAFKKN